MVDFNKIREQNKAKAEAAAKAPKVSKVPDDLDNLRHLRDYHLGELTEWEAGFVENNFTFLKNNGYASLSVKSKNKLGEILADHCGSDCVQIFLKD